MAILSCRAWVILRAYSAEAVRVYTDKAMAESDFALLNGLRNQTDSFALSECELRVGVVIAADQQQVVEAILQEKR